MVFSPDDGRVSQDLQPKAYLLDIIVELDDDKYLYETVLAVLAPGQTINTQTIIQNFVSSSSSESHTTVVFRDDNDDDDNEDEPSICFFEPNNEECDPVDGWCPEGFGMNEDGQCIPHGPCPDGFHRANDDETGRCIDEDELRECENNGGWVEEGEFCPEDELPFCNEDRSNEPCISGQEEPEAEPECEEGFVLENGVCRSMWIVTVAAFHARPSERKLIALAIRYQENRILLLKIAKNQKERNSKATMSKPKSNSQSRKNLMPKTRSKKIN